ncbi:MAG TPA: serine hydrolase, partial [Vicinamibacterales bacterium]|nr:serine hydrolase [Vicinamibacterales bacterium]
MPDGRTTARAALLILTLAVIAAAALNRIPPAEQQPVPSSSAAPAGTVASAPLDPADLSETGRAAAGLPRLHSLLVSLRGELILEHYARGFGASRLANIKSASKSIVSALVGIAIERGHIKGVHEPISAYFPELRRDPDPRKAAITIEDLLTMRSGLESTSGRNYGAWIRSRNWVRYALERPMIADPGTSMEYSTGSTHLLSAILSKATKMTTWQFARSALMKPLGVTLASWTRDPQGIFMGGNEMLMTPRQMLAFGEMYRNGGRVSGRQILSKNFIDETFE